MGKDKGAGKQEGGPNKKERNSGRTFDFSKHGSRYIALQLSYVGWGNQGFASQDTTEDTVAPPLRLQIPVWIAPTEERRCGVIREKWGRRMGDPASPKSWERSHSRRRLDACCSL